MSEIEQFPTPVKAETESTDHDKEQLAATLRETGARIDAILTAHDITQGKNFIPETEPQEHAVGDRYDVFVEREFNPDSNVTSYTVAYLEEVVPRDPYNTDTGEGGSDPYNFKDVSFEWELDADGNPVEIGFSTASSYDKPTEEDTTRGDLVVQGYGEDRLSAAVDASTALEAMAEANEAVTNAEAEGALFMRDRSPIAPTVDREQKPEQKFGQSVLRGYTAIDRYK